LRIFTGILLFKSCLILPFSTVYIHVLIVYNRNNNNNNIIKEKLKKNSTTL